MIPEQAYLANINKSATDGLALGHNGHEDMETRMIHVREGQKLLSMAGYLGGSASEARVASAPSALMTHAAMTKPRNQVDVVELHRLMAAKELRHQETFQIVLERCYRLVRRTAAAKRFACAFEVPEFIPGQPLYDIMKCIEHIMRSLTANGYAVQFVFPKGLLISWQIVQNKQQDAVLRNIYRMQQRSIESAMECQRKQADQATKGEQHDVSLIPTPETLHANLFTPTPDNNNLNNNLNNTSPDQNVLTNQDNCNSLNNNNTSFQQFGSMNLPQVTPGANILPPPMSTRMSMAPAAAAGRRGRGRGAAQQLSTGPPTHPGSVQFRSIAEFKPSGKFVLNV